MKVSKKKICLFGGNRSWYMVCFLKFSILVWSSISEKLMNLLVPGLVRWTIVAERISNIYWTGVINSNVCKRKFLFNAWFRQDWLFWIRTLRTVAMSHPIFLVQIDLMTCESDSEILKSSFWSNFWFISHRAIICDFFWSTSVFFWGGELSVLGI